MAAFENCQVFEVGYVRVGFNLKQATTENFRTKMHFDDCFLTHETENLNHFRRVPPGRRRRGDEVVRGRRRQRRRLDPQGANDQVQGP